MSASLNAILHELKGKELPSLRASAGTSALYLAPDSESPASHREFLAFLQNKKIRDTDVHFGIGNLFSNLDMIAYARYPHAILGDVNPNQVRLVDALVECLAIRGMDTTPEEFSAAFKDKLQLLARNDKRLEFYQQQLDAELLREGGWLREPELFRHIVALANDGNLIGLFVDLLDPKQPGAIADTVKAAGLTFGTVNLTNLPIFLKGNQDFYFNPITDDTVHAFWKNVEQFCNRLTTVCSACYDRVEVAEPRNGKGLTGPFKKDVLEYGTFQEQRNAHLARREAYAKGNRLAFTDQFSLPTKQAVR